MKFYLDLLAGAAACGVAYCLTRPESPRSNLHPVARSESEVFLRRGQPVATSEIRSSHQAATAAEQAPISNDVDAGMSIEQPFLMDTLRNEVITKTSEDMHRRGKNVMNCLDGVHLAGTEKLRFSVEVVSTPVEATTGEWRFVEIVDGEPLPESFASCAASAFGGGQHVVAPKDLHFPQYTGELPFLYTIPAPPAD
jgi:hypothetical protein